MRIVKEVSLPQGSDYFIRNTTSSDIEAYVLNNGKVLKYKASTSSGTYDNIAWEQQDFSVNASNILGIQGADFEETSIVVLLGNDATDAFRDPDNTELYDYRTPYRLYYAVDEDMVYQNIGGKWMPVATKDHDNLENKGKYSHAQIDSFIDSGGSTDVSELINRIAALEEVINNITFKEVP